MSNNNLIPIPGRLHDVSTDGVVSGADEIFDDAKGKRQSVINQETDAALENKYNKNETYSKQELNNLITTPNQEYVTVATYASLPATGEADTVYRVSNYDGEHSQVDATKYSEYAWNGTQYVFLCVKSQIGEVFDITAYNSNTKYADLTAALGTGGVNIPEGLRKGGMSVKYVQTSDNKYVRCNLLASSFTTDTTQWAIDDVGVYVENPEYFDVWLDSQKHVIIAIEKDGNIHFGAGVPEQVVSYVKQEIVKIIGDDDPTITIDTLKEITSFLNGFASGSNLLDYLNETYGEYVDNTEFIEVKKDANGKVFESTEKDGTKDLPVGVDIDGVKIKNISNSEYICLLLDEKEHLVAWVDKDRGIDWAVGIPTPIRKELDNLKNKFDTEHWEDIIPNYYFNDNYLPNKVDAINTELKNCMRENNTFGGDAFFFITDTHWEFNERFSPALIKYIREQTTIDTILHGGDLYQEHTMNKQECNLAFHKAIGNGRLFYAYGNHEFMLEARYADAYWQIGALQNYDAQYGDDTKLFYYVDVPQRKMRYISLISYGQLTEQGQFPYLLNPHLDGSGNVIDDDSIESNQYLWFRDSALDVEQGWTIVVFCHTLYACRPFTLDGACFIAMGEKYVELMDEYIGTGENAGNGEIACVLQGHCHSDRIHYSQAGIPYVMTTCDVGGRFGPDTEWREIQRVPGTINEQAFDVVIINSNITQSHPNKTVKLIRIGCPALDSVDETEGVQVQSRTVTYPTRQ